LATLQALLQPQVVTTGSERQGGTTLAIAHEERVPFTSTTQGLKYQKELLLELRADLTLNVDVGGRRLSFCMQ
jgi:hypothetical protein